MKPFIKGLAKSAIAIALAFTAATTSAIVAPAPIVAQAYSAHFDYTDARKLLGYVNNLRTNRNTSWWRDTSNNKFYVYNLRKLYWSRELEDIAKERAQDIVEGLEFEDPEEYLPSKWHYSSECLTRYFKNSYATFLRWCHTNEGFSKQAPRRNMLSRDVTYMGAACWVTSSGRRHYAMILGAVGDRKRQGIYKQDVSMEIEEIHLVEDGSGALHVVGTNQKTNTLTENLAK